MVQLNTSLDEQLRLRRAQLARVSSSPGVIEGANVSGSAVEQFAELSERIKSLIDTMQQLRLDLADSRTGRRGDAQKRAAMKGELRRIRLKVSRLHMKWQQNNPWRLHP